MPFRKRAVFLVPIILLVGGGYWWFSQTTTPPATTTESSLKKHMATPLKQTSPHNKLVQLAKHHCARLEKPTLAEQCVNQIAQDIQAGALEPNIPTFNPNACDDITDPMEKHSCFGWVGHNFAVSTGDITRCERIPLADIKASCQQAIIINEVKTLYSMDTNTTTEAPKP